MTTILQCGISVGFAEKAWVFSGICNYSSGQVFVGTNFLEKPRGTAD
ncbi:hypothetical protein [Brochothrix thermosphacta]|nr:hypothetical protein [Brochothrix thermosphacta]